MKKIKVMTAIASMRDGGAQQIVLYYLKEFHNDPLIDFHVFVYENPSSSKYDREIAEKHYNVTYLGNPKTRIQIPYIRRFFQRRVARKVWASAIKKFQPDIIHTHISPLLLEVWPGVEDANVPVRFHTLHSSPYRYKGFIRKGIIYALNCKNFVPVCITESQAKIAVDWYGLHHYELVKNGTDIGKIVSQLCPRDTARDIFHIPKDAFVILGVGRLAKVKNFPLLIDILKQVRKLNDKAILVIAGDGSERSFLQNYAKRNGVGTFTFFLGSISNVIPLYCASDVLAITSISEAFPLVFIEAQICHLRCVVSSVVPKENIITRTTKQLSAKAGLDEWVSAVMDVNYNSAVPPQLSGKDFDIHYQCNIMRNLYISGYNKTRVKDPE